LQFLTSVCMHSDFFKQSFTHSHSINFISLYAKKLVVTLKCIVLITTSIGHTQRSAGILNNF